VLMWIVFFDILNIASLRTKLNKFSVVKIIYPHMLITLWISLIVLHLPKIFYIAVYPQYQFT